MRRHGCTGRCWRQLGGSCPRRTGCPDCFRGCSQDKGAGPLFTLEPRPPTLGQAVGEELGVAAHEEPAVAVVVLLGHLQGRAVAPGLLDKCRGLPKTDLPGEEQAELTMRWPQTCRHVNN